MPGRVRRARHSDHSSAQLASDQLASTGSLANTGAGATTTGAGATTLVEVFDCDPEAADAVDGLAAIAATAIKTMIAEPRFPVFLAMSLSLSRHSSARTAVVGRSELNFAPHRRRLRPPSGGGPAAFHSIEGCVENRYPTPERGVRRSHARK